MKKIVVIIAAALAAFSCAKDGIFTEELQEGQFTRFQISDIDTKALLTDGYKIRWEAGKDKVSLFAKTDNCLFTAASGGDGSFWLEGTISQSSSTYYALFPYDADATNSTGTITTTLPAEQKAIPNQFSNIVAVAATKSNTLHFQNCVTLVEVNLATSGVNRISFRGNNGELVAGRLRMTSRSNYETEVPDPVIVASTGVKEVSISDGGKELAPGTYYIAIAPQVFTKGITITLSGKDGIVEKTTTKTVTATRSRRLLTGSLALEMNAYDSEFSVDWSDGTNSGTIYAGATKTFIYSYSGLNAFNYNVHSAYQVDAHYIGDGEEVDIPLIPEYTIEGSIGIPPTEATGNPNSNTTFLRSAEPRGNSASPVDLSRDNNTLFGNSLSGVNTANCYVVCAPGWYSFPLVYGNAIKNGAANTAAFAPSVSEASALSPFVKADGTGITSPYINGSGSVAVSARIEWQDVPGLIAEDIRLLEDGGKADRIVFNVPAETIREGNAVISALDANGGVVWSWHIWVLAGDQDLLKPIDVTNKAGKTYKFLPIDLGWVSPYKDPLVYPQRELSIRLTQHQTGKVIDLKVLQTGATITNILGNCPFYQWGRKDPFPAGDGTPNDDPMADCPKKTWYKTSGRDTTGTRSMRMGTNLAAYIAHPSCYNMDSNGDNTYANLWNATQAVFTANSTADVNAAPVVKTVYDPCPVGCCLPPIGAHTAFTQDNSLFFLRGYMFYAAPGKTGSNIFFPANGSMSTTNITSTKTVASLAKVGTGFSYWSGNANNKSAGFSFTCYNMGAPNCTYGSNRQYVFAIRPILEQ